MFEHEQFEHLNKRLDGIDTKLDKILLGEKQMAFDITSLQTAVTNETTVDQSVLALINSISGQLSTVLANSGNTVNPADIQAIVNTMQGNAALLQAAVSANTPAAPLSAALAANPQVANARSPAVLAPSFPSTAVPAIGVPATVNPTGGDVVPGNTPTKG